MLLHILMWGSRLNWNALGGKQEAGPMEAVELRYTAALAAGVPLLTFYSDTRAPRSAQNLVP